MYEAITLPIIKYYMSNYATVQLQPIWMPLSNITSLLTDTNTIYVYMYFLRSYIDLAVNI